MARNFLASINYNQNELQNARVQNLASAPSTPAPVSGQIYYDTAAAFTLVWNGASWIDSRARANHSGTQLAATISNLAATVQAYSLSTFAVPTANLAMGGFTLTGLPTPTAAGQAAEYNWVTGRNLNTIAGAAANTANVPMGGFKLTGLSTTPSASGDSAEYTWVLSRSLSVFAVPTANIPMGGFTLTGLAAPAAAGQAAEYSWVLSRSISAFAAPTGNIGMAGFTLTGLATPTAAGQAAEYSWVIGQIQSAAAGIASKYPVQAIATANITLSGLTAIDGYTPVAGDRILVVGQTTTSANGVYNAASGAWARTTNEGPAPGEIEPGALWLVINGTANAGTQWRDSNTGVITIGTTAITIVQFGAASVYSAGNGITLTGGVFSANPAAGGGITVSASGLAIDQTIVARKFSATIGDGSTTAIVVTHNLGTQDIIMQCRMATTPFSEVETDMAATSTTTATFTFAAAPAANAYRVTMLG